MHPPIVVNLRFHFLQVGAADGKRNAVFQDGHAVFDLHNVYHVYNAAPVNEKEFFRVQFCEYLLQALAYFGNPAGCRYAGILPLPS